MVKNTLARLWTDRCTATTKEAYTNERGADAFRDKIILKDEPCKLSFFNTRASNAAADVSGPAAPTQQIIKIILAPEHIIPPGSRIRVVREGRELSYAASAPPMVFHHHQEIILELMDEWA